MIDIFIDWLHDDPTRIVYLTLAADALVLCAAALLYVRFTRRRKT